MDSITQAVLGAAIGELMLGKRVGTKAAAAGAIIATIPDLDVLLYVYYNKFEMLKIHRGFSHSILFSIIAALLIAVLLCRIHSFKSIRFYSLLLFSWLALFTHILLDSFTAYGTQLLLPFRDWRIGFDSINLVDPLYTLPMLAGLVLSVWIFRSKENRSKFNIYGLIFSTLYLGFTLIHKQQVNSLVTEKFKEKNIEYIDLLTIPVGMANTHWYGVARNADSLYMTRYNIASGADEIVHAFPVNDDYLDEVDPEMAEVIRWFAKGFYTLDKQEEKIRVFNLQVDMRGIVHDGEKYVPTVGYFELFNKSGQTHFTSGSIGKE